MPRQWGDKKKKTQQRQNPLAEDTKRPGGKLKAPKNKVDDEMNGEYDNSDSDVEKEEINPLDSVTFDSTICRLCIHVLQYVIL